MSDEVTEPANVAEAIAAAQADGSVYETVHEETVETRPGDEVVEPVEEAVEPVETPAAEETVETPAADDEEEVDPYEPFGGAENMARLLRLQQGIQTDTGLRSFIAEGLLALKNADGAPAFTPEQVQAFLNGQGTPAPAPAAETAAPTLDDLEDDDVLTVAQAKALIAGATKPLQTAQEAQQAAEHERRVAAATAVIDGILIESIGDPDAEDPASTVDPAHAQLIMAAAGKYLAEDEWAPDKIASAMRSGVADFKKMVDSAKADYLRRKKGDKDAQPTSTGSGGAVGGEDQPEPKNTAEATKLFRAALNL